MNTDTAAIAAAAADIAMMRDEPGLTIPAAAAPAEQLGRRDLFGRAVDEEIQRSGISAAAATTRVVERWPASLAGLQALIRDHHQAKLPAPAGEGAITP